VKQKDNVGRGLIAPQKLPNDEDVMVEISIKLLRSGSTLISVGSEQTINKSIRAKIVSGMLSDALHLNQRKLVERKA
jgi:hypothetical protein